MGIWALLQGYAPPAQVGGQREVRVRAAQPPLANLWAFSWSRSNASSASARLTRAAAASTPDWRMLPPRAFRKRQASLMKSLGPPTTAPTGAPRPWGRGEILAAPPWHPVPGLGRGSCCGTWSPETPPTWTWKARPGVSPPWRNRKTQSHNAPRCGQGAPSEPLLHSSVEPHPGGHGPRSSWPGGAPGVKGRQRSEGPGPRRTGL